MKRVLGLAVVVLFVGIAFTATVNAGDKTWICHFDNSSDDLGHTKYVNLNAADDHIANHEGDYYLIDFAGEAGETCPALEQ
jgi:hypothetical protein